MSAISLAVSAQPGIQETVAIAQIADSPGFLEKLAEISVGSGEVMLLALFGGAMSFALMAAFWSFSGISPP